MTAWFLFWELVLIVWTIAVIYFYYHARFTYQEAKVVFRLAEAHLDQVDQTINSWWLRADPVIREGIRETDPEVFASLEQRLKVN